MTYGATCGCSPIHYGLGTYTNEQWATPNTPPSVFNPTALDTDQWAAAAKSVGMKSGVLTTRHHDGFARSVIVDRPR